MAKAYVLMNCDLGSEKNVIASLKEIDDVKEVHGTLGLYDIIAKIESDSEEKVKDVITNQIRKMSKIHSTMTLTRSESEKLFSPSEKLISAMLKEADVVFGFYDVICRIEASEYKILENVITKAIRALPHIRTSMTLNVIAEQES